MDGDFEQKILIVDDEPVNIRILIEALKGRYELIGATNGAEALECAMSEDPPDLILLDILMPDMDGYEVCRRLKSEPRTRNIAVIFITVMGEDVNEARGFDLGAVDYIAKPFSPAIVNARVQTHLELKRHRDFLERTLHERTEKLSDSTRRLQEMSYERMKIEEERKQLTTAIEHAAESFIITDTHGIIQYVNPVFERHTGYSSGEAIGEHISILESEEHDKAFYTGLWENIGQGNTWRGTFTNKRKDGSLYKTEAAVSPVFDITGKVVNFAAVYRDVTREIELEAQLRRSQKLEAIGTLAGGIAHDFNNIICAIMGYSELAMLNIPQESETFQYLARIDQAGRRAADLISQILAFGRKGEQKPQSMKIQPVIKEALKLLKRTLPSTIRIRQNIDENCRPILASPTRIYQVLMNLCTNAYHAIQGHNETPTLEMSLSDVNFNTEGSPGKPHDLSPGEYIRLRVSDNGHGMNEDTLSKIFDPYFTTKEVGRGTGLGLSTVYGIVRECGGTISVRSEPDRGSVFDIFFPAHRSDPMISERREPADPLPAPENHYSILLVDDEESIARMLETKLKLVGYDVHTYTDSKEALDAFSESPDAFDLVLTDMTMPNLTGLALAREILRFRTGIPVIIFSGFSEILTQEEAESAGVRKILKKPFIGGELEKAVREAVSCKL